MNRRVQRLRDSMGAAGLDALLGGRPVAGSYIHIPAHGTALAPVCRPLLVKIHDLTTHLALRAAAT